MQFGHDFRKKKRKKIIIIMIMVMPITYAVDTTYKIWKTKT